MGLKALAERNPWIWLFFRLKGRVGRQVFLLANLFVTFLAGLPYYRYMLATPGSPQAENWVTALGFALLVGTWTLVALGVKRLHDMDKPGVVSVSLLLPVVSLVAFVVLCVLPGTPGPNTYGARPDEPA